MSEFICIKEIPHLCSIGEKGTIVFETFTEYKDLIDEYNWEGWGFFRIIRKTVLKFNFKAMFYENHVALILGNPIDLNEHFKKIK